MDSAAVQFLSTIPPFTRLKPEELSRLAAKICLKQIGKGEVIAVQGRTIEEIHMITRGHVDLYYETKGKRFSGGALGPGSIFGGISILMNGSLSTCTAEAREHCEAFVLPKADFADICARHDAIYQYFAEIFGKRILDRSYAAIITKSTRPTETALRFFNLPVVSVVNKHPLHCLGSISIRQAAQLMNQNECSSIFVSDDNRHIVGIVTDHDLRKKVIAGGMDIAGPVSGIMSSPLVSIPAQALIFETLMEMMQRRVKHMAVTDGDGNVIGMVTSKDLLTAQGQSPLFLIQQIRSAATLEEIVDKHAGLPRVIQGLIHSGVKAQNVTRLITTISDAILTRILEFALDQSGPPPADFVFMVLGSEGRKEQTLKTDQDNAIVFRDVAPEDQSAAMAYFLALGEKVCNGLAQAGYAFCKGGVMAKNPKWCQPLSVWKLNFYEWIHAATPQDLLQASIFFDFRGAWGEFGLIDELRGYLFASLEGWAGFFRNLTENALHFKPPIGLLRNFVVESKGEHKDALDIKSAMLPIVDFARIYALKLGIAETNTLERLHQIHLKRGITRNEYHELEQAYAFMMQLRFANQVFNVLEENKPPDNYIKPKELSSVEQTTLKEIFKRVEKCQAKLGFEFTGIG